MDELLLKTEYRFTTFDHTCEIFEQREEILRAFVAKYGVGPEEIVQVVNYSHKGYRWWVERRTVV